MTKHQPEEYIFSCAIVRGNERTLLSRADLLKLVETKAFDQVLAMLADFGYGDGRPLPAQQDLEGLLTESQRRVRELIFSSLPDKTELTLLLYPSDYHNVKVLLKAEFMGIDGDAALTDSGSIPVERLKRQIKERALIFLSPVMGQAINEAVDLFARGKDPQEIDLVLDRACYMDMAQAAAQLGNAFIIGYVRLLVDILNINTFVRLRQMKKPWAFFQKVFLPGGTIDQRVFIASYEESYSQFADKLAPYGFREVMAGGAAQVQQSGKYTLLEKQCDDLRMQYIRNAKYVMMGIEPAAAFFLAKESEVKNLRMLLAGKRSSVPTEAITERLRETYV